MILQIRQKYEIIRVKYWHLILSRSITSSYLCYLNFSAIATASFERRLHAPFSELPPIKKSWTISSADSPDGRMSVGLYALPSITRTGLPKLHSLCLVDSFATESSDLYMITSLPIFPHHHRAGVKRLSASFLILSWYIQPHNGLD